MNESVAAKLRELPSVDELLKNDRLRAVRARSGERLATDIIRSEIEKERVRLLKGNSASDRPPTTDNIIDNILSAWQAEISAGLRRVINATGVIVHTNLGRAPLSAAAREALARDASGYCPVEYDLIGGRRGPRGRRAEVLIARLTGAESALIVNNGAAAAYLVMSVIAAGREVVISRGELVEIGGDFRVPDVLARSGAVLREVGTTNRTKLRDYREAISDQTAMLLRVHPSNYKIKGFTEKPGLAELAELAAERGVILYEDAGSGALIDLGPHGLADEPVISESVKIGADIVSFSGDKLVGGPQAGIIVGRSDLIARLRSDPLYRVLRVGKLIYSALEATLESYARGAAATEVPVLKMLAASAESIAARTGKFASALMDRVGTRLDVATIQGESVIGGGAGPDMHPKTTLVAIRPASMVGTVNEFERRLRLGAIPVIARLEKDRVLVDLRTVAEDETDALLELILAAAAEPAGDR